MRNYCSRCNLERKKSRWSEEKRENVLIKMKNIFIIFLSQVEAFKLGIRCPHKEDTKINFRRYKAWAPKVSELHTTCTHMHVEERTYYFHQFLHCVWAKTKHFKFHTFFGTFAWFFQWPILTKNTDQYRPILKYCTFGLESSNLSFSNF